MRIEWTEEAAADLESISKYIEADRGIETANRIVTEIFRAALSLERMPRRGREGRLPETRELILARLPYIVMYEILADRVRILSFVHGSQLRP